MTRLRVGVWGVGAWGEKHARIYASLAAEEGLVDLIGVCDRHAERSAAVAALHGCRSFGEPAELLAACDAISIALPTTLHRQGTEQALDAGCHVLVEKPIASSVEEAEAMIGMAQRRRLSLQVGHVERFNPALLAARPLVRAPKFIEAHRLAIFQPRSLDIDVVSDLMIHDIDAVLQIVGASPATVSAVGVAVLSPNEDIANARLEFENGCVANLTASRVSQERLRRLRFFQDDAYLSLDLSEKTGEMLWVDRTKPPASGLPDLAAIRRQRLEVPSGEPLRLELAAFVRSIRGDGQGAASAAAGRDALRVAEAVRQAMKDRAMMWATR